MLARKQQLNAEQRRRNEVEGFLVGAGKRKVFIGSDHGHKNSSMVPTTTILDGLHP